MPFPQKLLSLICLIFTYAPLLIFSMNDQKNPSEGTVLLAILAKNKAHVLPEYLNSISSLDYDKKLITVYINTNNNTDKTKEILEEWIAQNRAAYHFIIYEHHTAIDDAITNPHEWTTTRFKLLGSIRNKSLQQAKEHNCQYYFVVDCDNFIAPNTLKELIFANKPIVAPLLKAIPEADDIYSNYFCAIDERGYYHPHPDFIKILQREIVGTFPVPVVHCTYLIQSNYIEKLNYTDDTDDYEFVIFSRSARNNRVAQFICNKECFGTLLHFNEDISLLKEKQVVESLKKNKPDTPFWRY